MLKPFDAVIDAMRPMGRSYLRVVTWFFLIVAVLLGLSCALLVMDLVNQPSALNGFVGRLMLAMTVITGGLAIALTVLASRAKAYLR